MIVTFFLEWTEGVDLLFIGRRLSKDLVTISYIKLPESSFNPSACNSFESSTFFVAGGNSETKQFIKQVCI